MTVLLLHLRQHTVDPGLEHSPSQGSAGCLIDFCRERTPNWAPARDGVFLDLSGTGRLYGHGTDGLARVCAEARDQLGLAAGGAGSTHLVARLASLMARSWGPGHLLSVPPWATRSFLAGFSLAVMPVSPRLMKRLRQLGVHTLGDLQMVPRPLLKAVLGTTGVGLAVQAAGLDRAWPSAQTARETQPVWRVGFSCPRPLTSAALLRAARHGLAIRALTWFPAGPDGTSWWGLHARWPDGNLFQAKLPGTGEPTWLAWRSLIHRLWQRLPDRRSGLVHLELRAEGPLNPACSQISLFPADAAAIRLARVMRDLHGVAPGLMVPASEGLLRDRGVCWFQAACQVDGVHSD